MYVLRVFTDSKGNFGNPVGIVIDEEGVIGQEDRQNIARQSGFSEVVFVNNIANGQISIYTPQREIPFAGHAAVGVSYFLNRKYGVKLSRLIGIKGPIDTWLENGLTWVRGDLATAPDWNYEQLQTASQIDDLPTIQNISREHVIIWAWIDQPQGTIRARTFAPDWGIFEDEANGSGSMMLASMLNRKLTIRHGRGSVIYAKPSIPGFAEVGGLVTNS